MIVKLSRTRAKNLILLIQKGQEYLEKTEPLDPIDVIKAGDGIIAEIKKSQKHSIHF